jgi:hypothetical protein
MRNERNNALMYVFSGRGIIEILCGFLSPAIKLKCLAKDNTSSSH